MKKFLEKFNEIDDKLTQWVFEKFKVSAPSIKLPKISIPKKDFSLVTFFLSNPAIMIWKMLEEEDKWTLSKYYLYYGPTEYYDDYEGGRRFSKNASKVNLWVCNGIFFLQYMGSDGASSKDKYEFNLIEKFILWTRVSKVIRIYKKNQKKILKQQTKEHEKDLVDFYRQNYKK